MSTTSSQFKECAAMEVPVMEIPEFVKQASAQFGQVCRNAIASAAVDAAKSLDAEDVENIVKQILKSFETHINGLTVIHSRLLKTGTTLVQGIVYSINARDPKLLATTLAFILCDLLGAPVPVAGGLAVVLGETVRRVMTKQNSVLTVEGPDDPLVEEVAETLAAAWQAVGLALGVTRSKPKNLRDFALSCFSGISDGAKNTRNLLTMFSNMTKVIYRFYSMMVNYSLGVTTYSRLLYQDNGVMTSWTREANELLMPLNETRVINDKHWFARLCAANFIADYFIVEINRAKVRDVPPFLVKLKRDLQMLHVKAVNLGVVTAYRREPVCIWVSGPPGLGKTFLKDDITVRLLRAANIPTTGNDLYTMNVAQKHWTGAEDKQVIYYDDFGTINSDELVGECIGQFMQLISDCRFAPPQASLEDKGKAIAPALVYVNANESQPRFNCVRNNVAFDRRRHICVTFLPSFNFVKKFGQEANLETPGAKDWLSMYKTEEDPTPHVSYMFLDPVTNKPASERMQFKEMWDQVESRFIARYKESTEKYLKKMSLMSQLADERCEKPLEELLEDIKIRSIKQSGNPEFASIFDGLYRVANEGAAEARSLVNEWISKVTGWSMSVEGPAECRCDPGDVTQMSVEDDKLVWISGAQEGLFVDTNPCCSTCRKKLPSFVSGLKRFAGNVIVDEAIERYIAVLRPKPVPAAQRTFKYDVETQTMFEELKQSVPHIGWSSKQKLIGAGILACAGVFASCCCMRYFLRDMPEDDQCTYRRTVGPRRRDIPDNYRGVGSCGMEIWVPELISSGDNATPRMPTSRGITVKHVARTQSLSPNDGPMKTESGKDFLNIVDRAICYLVLDGVDKSSQKPVKGFPMRCFALAGHWLVVLKHYLGKIGRTDDVSLTFINYNATYTSPLSLEDCEIRALGDSEIVLVCLPNRIPLFKDVRGHIMTEKQSGYLPSQCAVYEKALGAIGKIYDIRTKVCYDQVYEDEGVQYIAPCVLSYTWHNPGRCMTPVTARFERDMIVGFHICGGGGYGAAEPVVRETFDVIGSVLTVQMPKDEWVSEDSKAIVSLDTNVVSLGVTKSKFSSRPAEKTCILPSKIHGYVPPTTRPAPLKPEDVGGTFSPLVTGVVKHGQPPKGFDPQLLARAKEHLREEYLQKAIPARAVVDILSVEEAVVGIPGLDGFQSMEMSTSEGFPYTATRPHGATNKRYLFELVEDGSRRSLERLDPALEARMVANERMRSKGIVPCTVFTDCLKDARIKNEKFFVPGKTRIFSISPADFTIQFRQYFCDILASQKINRFNLEHMVGINVHSLEWTLLARKLQTKGSKLLCGDYSNFGPGLDSAVVKAVGEVWCDWYANHESPLNLSEEETQRRRVVRMVMFEEMRHAVHQCGNILYRAPCGSPSGAPPTVNINNDVNKLYIYMAWLACWKDDPIKCTFVSFKKHCVLYVYGDDLIMNVSDEVAESFNNEYLQSFFAAHGIRYTDETKSGTVRKWVSFAEAGFLKGKWVPNEDRPFAYSYGLDKDSIRDCANWAHKAPDMVAASMQTTCDSLMLAYGWGRKFFDEHRRNLLSAWSDYEAPDLCLYTYDEMDAMRFGFVEAETESIEELVRREHEWRMRFSQEIEKGSAFVPLMSECLQHVSTFHKAVGKLRERHAQMKRCGINIGLFETYSRWHKHAEASLRLGRCIDCGEVGQVPLLTK